MDPVTWLLGLGSLLMFGIVVVHLLAALVLVLTPSSIAHQPRVPARL